MIEIEIDGQKVETRPGTTILAVARSVGIDIPTLCHHEALEPYGACRLCLVELSEAGRQSIVAACNYPLERSGLTVKTDTPAVRQARKMSLKLLLARCPTVTVLQELAREWEVNPADLLIIGDGEEECILCGLCVRVCREVIGKNVISFAYRSVERRVSTPFDRESDLCLGCTACAFVCPTGAIKVDEAKGRLLIAPWHSNLEQARCSSCGRPVAPAGMLAHLSEKLEQEPETGTLLCSRCRRLQAAAAAAALPEVRFADRYRDYPGR
jgi:NADH dehydrogenase/NADH:ubiquinone oxidoreductase subunit G